MRLLLGARPLPPPTAPVQPTADRARGAGAEVVVDVGPVARPPLPARNPVIFRWTPPRQMAPSCWQPTPPWSLSQPSVVTSRRPISQGWGEAVPSVPPMARRSATAPEDELEATTTSAPAADVVTSDPRKTRRRRNRWET